MKQIILLIVALLFIVGLIGTIWLANAHLMPPTQKVEQTIPDDHIPR